MISLANADAMRMPLPDQSIQCVVTSPPYWGLRKYEGVGGTVWPAVTYTPMPGMQPVTIPGDAECDHDWREFARPEQSGGKKSTKVQIKGSENFQVVSPSTQAYCQRCGAWRGMLGLEPTPEMFVAHLVLILREVWWVLRDDGVCWLNLGDSYAGGGGYSPGAPSNQAGSLQAESGGEERNIKGHHYNGLPAKNLCGIPWRVAFALQADGWYLRSDIIWAKGLSFCDSYAGSCMPESVRDRPTKAHEYLFLLAKSKRYFYDAEAVREQWADARQGYAGGDPAKRKFSWREIDGPSIVEAPGTSGRNLRDVWVINPAGYPGSHYAVFPEELVEPCIKAGTSERGACPVCGAPWERVVEKTGDYRNQPGRSYKASGVTMRNDAEVHGGRIGDGRDSQTLGWQPTCNHDAEPMPCLVLDPFAGRGTTAKVARDLGRDCVLLDLSGGYLRENAREHLGLDRLAAWGGNIPAAPTNLDGLPLFGGGRPR